jgi:CBS domain-containing protein
MKPFQIIVTCIPSTPLSIVTSLVLFKRVGSVLVAEGTKYFGFITKHDLLEAYHCGFDPLKTTVSDIMKRESQLQFAFEFDTLDKVFLIILNLGRRIIE